MREGKLNSSQFRERMTGTGILAQQISTLFKTFATKLGFKREHATLRTDLFRPTNADGQFQQRLF